MALIMFDGFDGYNNYTDLTTNGGWNYCTAGVPTSPGRTGTGQYFSVSGVGAIARWGLNANYYNTNLYIGFALNMEGSTSDTIFYIGNISDAEQCSIKVIRPTASTYYLYAYRGSNLIGSGTILLNNNTWYYVQLKIKCHGTTGTFGCKIEGADNFTEFTGNTQNSGANEAYFLRFMSNNFFDAANKLNIDDLYVCNSSGTFNNTYLGEVIAKQVPLTGDSSIAFSRNTGTTNYGAVDDPIGIPDDGTTYVYSSTPGNRDEYTLTNTSGTSAVYGVKVNTRAKKDNSNPRSIKYGIKTGADQRDTIAVLGTGYSNYQAMHETYDGTNQWTTAKLDAAVATLEVV